MKHSQCRACTAAEQEVITNSIWNATYTALYWSSLGFQKKQKENATSALNRNIIKHIILIQLNIYIQMNSTIFDLNKKKYKWHNDLFTFKSIKLSRRPPESES